MTETVDYKSSGVNYESIDPLKVYAQRQAQGTSMQLKGHGFSEVGESRGESAYVFDMGKYYGAKVTEGLGTKNLVAEDYGPDNEKYWRALARDTVAMIVNDLATVGATPVIITPHWAAGSSQWFENRNKWKGLVDGWVKACLDVGASYAAGETAALPGIVKAETVELSGSAFGIVSPKERLTMGKDIKEGDSIVLIESSGIHANGLSLVRRLASEMLLEGYNTKIPDGREFGEALLTPTHLYPPLVNQAFEQGLDIHYMVNITGHGWRKLMRANEEYVYRIHTIPRPQEEFDLIRQTAQLDDCDMYGTFNMGAGYAFILPASGADKLVAISESFGLGAIVAGSVEEGPKKVIIEPKDIEFSADSLSIR